MYETAKVLKCQQTENGTYMAIFIPGKQLKNEVERKNMDHCGVWLNDGRRMTAKQRGLIYATLADIAVATGDSSESVKLYLKNAVKDEYGLWIDSFSHCSIDDARVFIKFMLEFVIYHGFQVSPKIMQSDEFMTHIMYCCLKYRKCAICGRSGADLHHVDTIGMGNDRATLDDSKKRKMSLCREHHQLAEQIGQQTFDDLYHVTGIIFNEEQIRSI